MMINIDTHSTTLSVPDINSIIFTKGYCSPENLIILHSCAKLVFFNTIQSKSYTINDYLLNNFYVFNKSAAPGFLKLLITNHDTTLPFSLVKREFVT